jgi:hypothetical protein
MHHSRPLKVYNRGDKGRHAVTLAIAQTSGQLAGSDSIQYSDHYAISF